MKISTKTGDEGKTSLLNGERVFKNDLRIEACGVVDELNSSLGLADASTKIQELKKIILEIQHQLFIIGANLALPIESTYQNLPKLDDQDLKKLEDHIDILEKKLPELKEFILPGGSFDAAILFNTRSISRRAERKLVAYIQAHKIKDDKKGGQIFLILKYLNRLSDLLFLLSRYANFKNRKKEIKWQKSSI